MDLNHLGTQTLRTERLILRKFMSSDAGPLYYNWANDDDVTRYLSWKTHSSLDESIEVVQRWVDSYNRCDSYIWAITLKSGEVMGSIDLHEIKNCAMRCDVGYCIGKVFWNKGYMTEALVAVLDYGLNTIGFHRIQAYHDVNNTASGRVMQKAGMNFEGTLRKYCLTGTGNLADCDMYAKIKD